MTVKRFLGLALFTWLMCWAVATGFSNDPAKLSPVVQTSPRITVQIYTPSQVQGQLYPPTTTTTTVAPVVFAEELRNLPCAHYFLTGVKPMSAHHLWCAYQLAWLLYSGRKGA